MKPFIHKLADVQTKSIGARSRVWQYVVILPGARVGADCNICSLCFIENNVIIGDRVTIKSGVQLWDGIRIGNNVFIGPNVAFGNDRFPRSKKPPEKFLETIIEDGASIGSGAVILPGLIIGKNAMVGAGAVVSRSIPPNSIVSGNPARIRGYVAAKKTCRSTLMGIQNLEQFEEKSIVTGVKAFNLPRFSDIRGDLAVGEISKFLPFKVKRYFVVYNVPSKETRGEHAHKECHQFLICVKGSCSVIADNGLKREEFSLSAPHFGLYFPPLIWGTQFNFTQDAVLLVLASDPYNCSDYITKYDEFLAAISSHP